MNTIVMTEAQQMQLLQMASDFRESACILLTRIAQAADGNLRILVRSIRAVPEHAYEARSNDGLTVTSEGYVDALADASNADEVAFFVHSHPTGEVKSSAKDDVVDKLLSEVFRIRTGSEYYGSLIISNIADKLVFSGFVDCGGTRNKIDRAMIVGDRWRLQLAYDEDDTAVSEQFDRNIRAFGGGVQQMLGLLRVGVVGCGGTGSAVIEQLVRLGVRDFLLIDPDKLSLSNVTRVYGSTPTDVGTTKVDLLAKHIEKIASDAKVIRVCGDILDETTAKQLGFCDIVFGCTDDNAGRIILSRLATFMMMPIIDCGVLLASTDGLLTDIIGRVSVLSPGAACMTCRGRVDMRKAGAEFMNPAERERLARENYAPELGDIEPAVVTFTTMTAAQAVAEFLERLIGYGPMPVPSETLMLSHERYMSTSLPEPLRGHFCHPESGKLGHGMAEDFLELSWRS